MAPILVGRRTELIDGEIIEMAPIAALAEAPTMTVRRVSRGQVSSAGWWPAVPAADR